MPPPEAPIILGRYSPSQNGTVISPNGIAPCIAGGGKGHDTDKPKILIEHERIHRHRPPQRTAQRTEERNM